MDGDYFLSGISGYNAVDEATALGLAAAYDDTPARDYIAVPPVALSLRQSERTLLEDQIQFGIPE